MAQAADDTVHRGDGHAGTLQPQPRSGAGDDGRATFPALAAEFERQTARCPGAAPGGVP